MANLNAIRFFQDNAGYATPPGRMACAKEYALAEEQAMALGWSYLWVQDDEPYDPGDMQDYTPDEVLGCIMMDDDGKEISSLWGIADPDADYERVVQAELASEALVPIRHYESCVDTLLARI